MIIVTTEKVVEIVIIYGLAQYSTWLSATAHNQASSWFAKYLDQTCPATWQTSLAVESIRLEKKATSFKLVAFFSYLNIDLRNNFLGLTILQPYRHDESDRRWDNNYAKVDR